jgi:ribosomal protein S18 acetylase RimI-like enzyme
MEAAILTRPSASIAPTAASVVVGARLTLRPWDRRRDRRAAARWQDTTPFLRVWSVQNHSRGARESWGILHSNMARIGLYLAPGWTGQGYGREALGLMLHYCFAGLKLEQLALDVAASNQRALKCYLAVGFQYQYSEWRAVGPDPALALLDTPEYAHLKAFFDADFFRPACSALFYELVFLASAWKGGASA